MVEGWGSSNILIGLFIPKSTDSPPKKEDYIILSSDEFSNYFCIDVFLSY